MYRFNLMAVLLLIALLASAVRSVRNDWTASNLIFYCVTVFMALILNFYLARPLKGASRKREKNS